MATNSASRKDYIKQLRQLRTQKDFDGMLSAAQEALKAFPGDSTFISWLKEGQEMYVHQKLESPLIKNLEEKNDFKTLEQIYSKLLEIFPGAPEVLKRIGKLSQERSEAEIAHSKEILGKAMAHIESLLKSGKAELALQATYEILSHDPSNKKLLKLLARAQKEFQKEVDKELIQYFVDADYELKEEYKEAPESFTRV